MPILEQRSCNIESVGLSRNGQSRWWCTTHGANAAGHGGLRLPACEGAATLDAELRNCLELDPSDYEGGVAAWAALEPVFDTTKRNVRTGVHVHARKLPGGSKQIDRTYSAVAVRCKPDLFGVRSVLIRKSAAVSYYFSRLLGLRAKNIFCPNCGSAHLDSEQFAVSPHRQHLCHGCGKYFRDREESISNPIAYVRDTLGDYDSMRQIVKIDRKLDVDLSDYPGGVQIWASNPAIFWTAQKPEEEGIHVHLYEGARGAPIVDETYSEVVINGVRIEQDMVRHLMAQQAQPYLKGRVEALRCSACSSDHFDRERSGFEVHGEHLCEHCGQVFQAPGRPRHCVSNPLVSVLARLGQAQSDRGKA